MGQSLFETISNRFLSPARCTIAAEAVAACRLDAVRIQSLVPCNLLGIPRRIARSHWEGRFKDIYLARGEARIFSRPRKGTKTIEDPRHSAATDVPLDSCRSLANEVEGTRSWTRSTRWKDEDEGNSEC